MNNKKVKKLHNELCEKYNITIDEIKEIIEAPEAFTTETINNIDFKNINSENIKEFKLNFIYKYWGKLHTNINLINIKNGRKS